MAEEKTTHNAVESKSAPHLQIYITTLNAIQEQIRFADSKAGFITALNILLFGFIASHFDNLKALHIASGGMNFTLWTAVFYIIAAAASVTLIIWSVIPRFGKLAPKSRTFFGHITTQYGKDYGKYVQETSNMTENDWAKEIGTQIVEVSHIAQSKHNWVRWGAILALMAFLLWIIVIIALVTG